MLNRFLPPCWVVLSIVIGGCGGETPAPASPAQTSKHSFPEAMKMLCNVDELAKLTPEEDLLEVGRKRSAWLSDEVDNGDFIEFRTLVSVKLPEEQVAKIRAKAKEVGIASCPLADSIEKEPTGVLVP
jgi:hypothetical protein